MVRKLTPSQDGKLRANIHVPLRLVAKEIEKIKQAARADNTPWHQWLVQEAYSAIDRAPAPVPRMGRTGDSPEEVGAFLSAG
jgi:hypothetical protein